MVWEDVSTLGYRYSVIGCANKRKTAATRSVREDTHYSSSAAHRNGKDPSHLTDNVCVVRGAFYSRLEELNGRLACNTAAKRGNFRKSFGLRPNGSDDHGKGNWTCGRTANSVTSGRSCWIFGMGFICTSRGRGCGDYES